MSATFTARTAALLGAAGVPLTTVMTEGIRLEPTPEGYLLRWDGAVKITAEQASALVAPDD